MNMFIVIVGLIIVFELALIIVHTTETREACDEILRNLGGSI